jgi:parallel beta-helix repeat protein
MGQPLLTADSLPPQRRLATALGFAAFLLGSPSLPPSAEAAAPGSLSVRSFGAEGDGVTPDTDAIQAAVNALLPGQTLRFPPGTYLIETDKGVLLKDGARLDLGNATLFGPNVDGYKCRIFEIQSARDVRIRGGTLRGSRTGRPNWGVGILASDAQDLVIENLTARDFYFDGILLTGNLGSERVLIRNFVAENNRRTGMAIVHARDVTVERSTFRGSRGQSPEAGVNGEPHEGEEIRNVAFRGCSFLANANVGLYLHPGFGLGIVDVFVSDAVVEDNGYGIIMNGVDGLAIVATRVARNRKAGASGIVLGDKTKRAALSGNVLEDNLRGILVAGAQGVEIRSNTVTGAGPVPPDGISDARDGIVCLGLYGLLEGACVVSGNTVRGWPGSGLVGQLVTRVEFADNTVEDVGRRGVYLHGTTESDVRGNTISGTGQAAPGQYDAIELQASSSYNRITGNTIRSSPTMRQPIGICLGCTGNQVEGNTIQ